MYLNNKGGIMKKEMRNKNVAGWVLYLCMSIPTWMIISFFGEIYKVSVWKRFLLLIPICWVYNEISDHLTKGD